MAYDLSTAEGRALLASIVKTAQDPDMGVSVKDRTYHMKKYKRCFVGSDLVDWLATHNHSTRDSRSKSFALASQMLKAGLIRHVTEEHDFKDDKLFYRFTAAAGAQTPLSRSDGNPASASSPPAKSDSDSNGGGGSSGGGVVVVAGVDDDDDDMRHMHHVVDPDDELDEPMMRDACTTARMMAALRHTSTRRAGVNDAVARTSSQRTVNDIDVSTALPGDSADDERWQELSRWLQAQKLKDIKTLPADLTVDKEVHCPGFGVGVSSRVVEVRVLKRFNSRKLPHFLLMKNKEGKEVKFIFKQDDDISMDVAVLKLLELSTLVWREKKLKPSIRTYYCYACPDLTGFVEVIPGQTMLKVHADDIVAELGDSIERWERFYRSLLAIIVTTAAFDITDRHHNNVMFTPDGDVALIDLSASLGNKAPLDAGLKMNPVYFPKRLRKCLKAYSAAMIRLGVRDDEFTWHHMEEDAVAAYYALYNSTRFREVTRMSQYKMYTPNRYVEFLATREHDKQKRERTRNVIVNTMDSNATVNKMVAGITSVLPMN